MKREAKNLDRELDQLIAGIRDERIDPEAASEAAGRVWDRVRQEARAGSHGTGTPLQDESDYESLIPAYVAGKLGDARRLLVEDHMRESVSFRKKVMQARAGAVSTEAALPKSARRRLWSSEISWAIAAAVLIAVMLVGLRLDLGLFSVKTGGMVTIKQVEGELFRVSQAGTVPVGAGDSFRLDPKNRDGIRTAKGSRAMLELADGSLVEMKERSQLSVLERHSRFGGEKQDSTIALDRGSVIVEAADQGDGQLFVKTDDCTVEVKGTVFSVNNGMKGSRVSVIEGEVLVHADDTDVLRPGDQVATSASVGRVPLAEEIGWSRNVDRHLALLAELTDLGKELDQIIAGPELRHSTRLLDRAPAGTVVYAAIPNFSDALNDAYSHVRAKVDANPVLREWWQESVVASGSDAELAKAMEKIRDYGEQFGEEIVFTLQADAADRIQDPLILAELERPAEFGDRIVKDFLELGVEAEGAPNLVLLEGAVPTVTTETRPGGSDEFNIWIHDGFLAASPNVDRIRQLAASVAEGSSGFEGTRFHGRLSELYREGVEWALGVDLQRIIGSNADDDIMEQLGFLDIEHLIVQHRDDEGKADTRAVLSFSQARRGVAAWLAEPAPMGGLEFVSPDANLAAAFVMKTPTALVDELFTFLASEDDGFHGELDEFEQEYGLDIREDFAAALGGEFAFALDGPVLPKPSWKFVMEVYDPARLQKSLELAVTRINDVMAEHGRQGFSAATQESGNLVFHEIRSLDAGVAIHYTFVDGYMIAGPSRTLLERAVDGRRNGITLPRSGRFIELLPRDGQLNFSAVAYQNLGSLLGPLAGSLKTMVEQLGPEQAQMIEALGRDTSASLAFAYGKEDRIVVASSSQEGFFSSGLNLFQLQSLMSMRESVERAVQPGAAGSN